MTARHRLTYLVFLFPLLFWEFFFYLPQGGQQGKLPPMLSENQLYPSGTKLLNLTHFRYVINNHCASQDDPPWTLVVLVTSNARDFGLRNAQREAFPQHVLRREGVRRVFLLARDHKVKQDAIERENMLYKDLVQGSFEEAYKHLSYKHIMGLQWAVNYCTGARYILKMDDDIAVDFFQFLRKLRESNLQTGLLGYKQRSLAVQRNPSSKWFVPKSERREDEYPDFLSGWAYATTWRTARDLVSEASKRDAFFWIDDIWVTGMLAESVGAKLSSLNTFYTVYAEHLQCCLEDQSDPPTMCDFIVGPSLDDSALIKKLGALAVKCHARSDCQRRTWQQSVIKTCVKVDNPFFLPETKGVGEVIVINNRL